MHEQCFRQTRHAHEQRVPAAKMQISSLSMTSRWPTMTLPSSRRCVREFAKLIDGDDVNLLGRVGCVSVHGFAAGCGKRFRSCGFAPV
jgi:hypothetical protein